MITKIIALIETFTGFTNHRQFLKKNNGILVMNVKATPEQESQLLSLVLEFNPNWGVICTPNPTGFSPSTGKKYEPTVYMGLLPPKNADDTRSVFAEFKE